MPGFYNNKNRFSLRKSGFVFWRFPPKNHRLQFFAHYAIIRTMENGRVMPLLTPELVCDIAIKEIESMDKSTLKKSAFSGAIWKFAEQFGAQMISLVVSTVLARILTPDDYSIVGIVSIFFAFSNVFITSGFNTALIRKKDATMRDYSSVLAVSLFVALLIYGLLFAFAPSIADIYQKPLLIPVFRVMGLVLVINAVKSVVCAYVSNNLQFRKFFFATLSGMILSAVVGITMAVKGFGPWALVAQNMTSGIVDTVILFLITKFRPSLRISWKSIKELFDFGWKIFVASIINVLYDEVHPLVIGLRFSATDLSYYTKGKSYPTMLQSSVNGTLSAVLFPVMSKVQDDTTALLNYTRRFIRIASFLIFPIMMGFLAVSENFVRIILTDKWLPAVSYIQIFCLSYMFNMVQTGNLQTIRAMGRSDIILKLEIIKKVIYLAVTVVTVLFAKKPEALAMSVLLNTVIAMVINSWPNKSLIGYGFLQQIKDILPNLVISIAMGLAVSAIGKVAESALWVLAVQVLAGAVIYVGINWIFKNPDLGYVFQVLRAYRKRGRKENG